MRMHVLSGGRLKMKKHIFVPQADRSEFIDLAVPCFLIRHRQGNVLFDTGCHPDASKDPEGEWGGLAKAMTPVAGPDENVISGLGQLGLKPDDIDVVVNSHFHTDHCGCNRFFSKATVVVHEAELRKAQDPASEGMGYFTSDWNSDQSMDLLIQERDLFSDERIVLVPLPGHTPGMTGALVNLDADGSFLLASDSVSLLDNLDPEIMPKNMWDADLSYRSVEEVRRLHEHGTQVLCGHDAEQWKTLKKGADAYV